MPWFSWKLSSIYFWEEKNGAIYVYSENIHGFGGDRINGWVWKTFQASVILPLCLPFRIKQAIGCFSVSITYRKPSRSLRTVVLFLQPTTQWGDVVTSLPDIPTSPSIRIFPTPPTTAVFEIKGIDGTYIKLKMPWAWTWVFSQTRLFGHVTSRSRMYLLEVTAGNHSILHVEKIIKL